jgi:subtilase family serine protease
MNKGVSVFRQRLWPVLRIAALTPAVLALAASGAAAKASHPRHSSVITPRVIMERPVASGAADGASGTPDCTTPATPTGTPAVYPDYHCYTPQQIRSAYDVDGVANLPNGQQNFGQGQTIVLVDAYGSPTAAQDLKVFHDTFFPNLADPDFTQVYPNGAPDYKNIAHGQGLSGPNGAAGWSGEAELDIEWSYAMAPLAHIVLLAVPPSETEGVQGLPNLFKSISSAINTYPAGTVFSMSWGVSEQSFGGAAQAQVAKYDKVFQAGIAKGDTFFSASGDSGTTGTAKQHKETGTYSYPTNGGWPGSSPYVTAVGGTQLQYGWTWHPTSDTPFESDGITPNDAYFNSTPGGDTEAVWNETWLPAASSGGPSVIYPLPSWQSKVEPVIGSDVRGIPDLAWNAAVNGGVLEYITAYPNYQPPGWGPSGGTSAASPQVAGVVALANAQRAAEHKAPLGNINPVLYSLPSNDYRDIVPVTEGTAASGVLDNNQLWQYNADGSVSPGPVAGFPTLSNWDMTTGFGSPVVGPFVAALAGH